MITDLECGVVAPASDGEAPTEAPASPPKASRFLGKRHAWHEGLILESTFQRDVNHRALFNQ